MPAGKYHEADIDEILSMRDETQLVTVPHDLIVSVEWLLLGVCGRSVFGRDAKAKPPWMV